MDTCRRQELEEKVNVFYQAIEFAMAGCSVKFRMCVYGGGWES